MSERAVAAARTEEDAAEASLRPQTLNEFIGQKSSRENLSVFIEAARSRGEALDHVLLHGPPGLGKTTLGQIVARELGVGFRATSGPVIQRAGDLAAILTNLQPRDVLFIDEIHRLPAVVEEYLYAAMEDFKVDVTLDAGMHARTITMPLPAFTLIGATTRIGLLTGPMRSRFGIRQHIEFYRPEALHEILRQNGKLLKLDAADAALWELANRSRGTPRIANRLLRRARDYAAVVGKGMFTVPVVKAALDLEGIDARGLDEQDRQFLKTLIEVYAGGPAGIEALAATMGEEIDTLVDVIEPYLLQTALVTRTRQGRRATKAAYEHMGLKWSPPRDGGNGDDLFGAGDSSV